MISVNTEQHLGLKAFIILILRRVLPGIVIIILSIVITIFGKFISSDLIGIFKNFDGLKNNATNITSEMFVTLVIIIFYLGVLACFLGLIISYLQYHNYTYKFDEFDLIIKKGVLDLKENSVPYRQIQDVNIERSLGYQILGLSCLIIRTAGVEEKGEKEMTVIRIEPIEKDVAEEIQNILERKIGVQIIEGDVKADKEEKNEEKHFSL